MARKTLAQRMDELQSQIDDLSADVERTSDHEDQDHMGQAEVERIVDVRLQSALADLERRVWRLEILPRGCECPGCKELARRAVAVAS